MNGRPPVLKSPLKSPPYKLEGIQGSPQIMPTSSPLRRKYVPKPNNYWSNSRRSNVVSPSQGERVNQFNRMALEAQKQLLDQNIHNLQNMNINFEDFSRNQGSQAGQIPDSMDSVTKVETKEE